MAMRYTKHPFTHKVDIVHHSEPRWANERQGQRTPTCDVLNRSKAMATEHNPITTNHKTNSMRALNMKCTRAHLKSESK